MRGGAAQAEVHPRDQILVRPAQPVGLGRGERVLEGAADIGRAHHRMAAVEMGVDVDQHRPKLSAAQIDGVDAHR